MNEIDSEETIRLVTSTAHRLFYTEFIDLHHILLPPEQKYNLYQLLWSCGTIQDESLYTTIISDESLCCYEIPRKHMERFRKICHHFRTVYKSYE